MSRAETPPRGCAFKHPFNPTDQAGSHLFRLETTVRFVLTDRAVIAGALVAAAGLAAFGGVIVPPLLHAAESAAYERPSTISIEVEKLAYEYAEMVIGHDDFEVRFDQGDKCPPDTAGCVRPETPTVIRIVAYTVGIDLNYQRWNFLAVVVHEATHVSTLMSGVDLEAFTTLDPEVEPVESVADCVAQALIGRSTVYLDECPTEYQEIALNAVGIDRAVVATIDGELVVSVVR